MSLLEELLSPIEEGAPAGPNLRDSNDFAAIERAFLDADQPAVMMPGGAADDGAEQYEQVVSLCMDFLETRSKDLKVAVFLTASLLRVQGFPGLADGLEVIKGLLETFWEDLHPSIPSRAPILDWFGSEDLSYALYLVPLTEFGHRYTDYKSWAKEDAGAAKSAEGQEGQDFGSAFGQTSREWYEEMVSGLHRARDTLEALDALGKARFPETKEKPPRYSSLADALKRVTAAGEDLLGRKPAPPKPVEPARPPSDEVTVADAPPVAASSTAAHPVGATSSPPAPVTVSAEPRNEGEAAALVIAAARVMRKEKPWSPAPYLLLRGLRWGQLREGGDPPDPRTLEPPPTSSRTQMKSLFLDKEWGKLLETGEEIMATPAGRAWLDLQRYAVLAAERLGQDFEGVARSVKGALAALLRDLPSLADATLMDDSPVASRDTLAWLAEEGLLPGGDAGREREEAQARQADRVIREASFDRAAAMARGGDPQGAVEMLMDRAEHERSQRARFIAKSEAAGIMVEHGMNPVARPILDELYDLVDKHQLESWEPADVVAKPLGLLIRCLDAREGAFRQQIYPRLAKLDPLMAMRVNQPAVGTGNGGEENG